MKRALSIGVAALLLTGLRATDVAAQTAPEHGTPEDPSKRMLDEAADLYDDDQFEEALRAFEDGYRRFGEPLWLFNIGQARRHLNDCPAALAAYEKFLATAPPDDIRRAPANRWAAEMRTCASAARPAVVELRSPLTAIPEPPPSRRPRLMRAATFGLIGVGVAAAVGATIFAILARRDAGQLSMPRTPWGPGAMNLDREGRLFDALAIGLAVTAVASGAGGVTLLLLSGPSRADATARAQPAGLLLRWSGPF